MFNTSFAIKHFAIAALIVAFGTSCSSNDNKHAEQQQTNTTEKADSSRKSSQATTRIDATGPKPSWAPDIKNEMLAVIEKLKSFNAPDITTLTGAEARKQPTPTDAIIALIKEHTIILPPSKVDTSGKDIPVKGGFIHLRIYTPKEGTGPFPVIVYYHGGGWVIANLDTYDASAKTLAEQTGSVLVSVAYRQAPEHKFPTAHNDSYAAYEWVLKNAASINGDPKQIVVAGESAGGNLACAVSIMARDKGVALPIHQLLVYPIAGYDTMTTSYKKYADAKPLNKPMMEWFFKQYLNSPKDGSNKWISLVNANLKGLPPTTLITAELDPLQSDGELLSEKLKAAGVKVEFKKYDGVTHEFFGMGAILPEAMEAEMFASDEIKKSFAKK